MRPPAKHVFASLKHRTMVSEASCSWGAGSHGRAPCTNGSWPRGWATRTPGPIDDPEKDIWSLVAQPLQWGPQCWGGYDWMTSKFNCDELALANWSSVSSASVESESHISSLTPFWITPFSEGEANGWVLSIDMMLDQKPRRPENTQLEPCRP